MARTERESKRKKDNKSKKDKASKELKKILDNDLEAALSDSEDHETRIELLLIQLIREMKK